MAQTRQEDTEAALLEQLENPHLTERDIKLIEQKLAVLKSTS